MTEYVDVKMQSKVSIFYAFSSISMRIKDSFAVDFIFCFEIGCISILFSVDINDQTGAIV